MHQENYGLARSAHQCCAFVSGWRGSGIGNQMPVGRGGGTGHPILRATD